MTENPLLTLNRVIETIVSSIEMSGASTPELVKEVRSKAKKEIKYSAARLEEIAIIKLISGARGKKGKAGKGIFYDTPLLKDINFNNSYAVRHGDENKIINKNYKKMTINEMIEFYEQKYRIKNMRPSSEIIVLKKLKDKIGDGSISIEDAAERLKILD